MIFNKLPRFNNTLTPMITGFNKYRGTVNDFSIIDNRKGVFNPDDSGIINKSDDRRFGSGTGVKASAIASVLSGHFDTIPANLSTKYNK
jgi:diaminopimelate epimerase